MKAQLVEEKNDHYVLKDAQSTFRVPKRDLSEAMHQKIRSMGRKMADGGTVGDSDPVDVRTPDGRIIRTDAGFLRQGGMEQIKASPEWSAPAQGPAAEPTSNDPSVWDTIKNAASEASNYGAKVTKAAGNPLGPVVGLLDAYADARKTPGFNEAVDSAGNAVGGALKSVAPSLLGTAEAASPKAEAPSGFRQPPVMSASAPAGAPARRTGTGGSGPVDQFGNRMDAEHQKEMSAIDAQTKAQMDKDTAKADILKNQQEQAADIEVQRQGMQNAYHQTYDAEFKKFQTLTDKYAKAEIDPHKFWASRSTGDKVLAAIGLAMGALGSQDGVNRSVAILNQAIDRDIDAQKANLAAMGAKADSQQNLLGIMRQNFGDSAQALNATEAAMRQNALAKIDEMALRFSGPEKQAAAAAMKARMSQDYMLNVQKTQADVQLKAAEAAKNWAMVAKSKAAGPGKSAGQYQTMSQTIGELKGLINNTNAVTEKVGDKAAKMQTLAASLLLQVKDQEKLGALDKGSVEIAEKIIGDPGATFTMDSTKIAKLDSLLNQAARKARNSGGVNVPVEDDVGFE